MGLSAARRWLPLLGVAGLLAVAAMAAARSSLRVSPVEPLVESPSPLERQPRPSPEELTPLPADGPDPGLPVWTWTALAILIVAVVSALVAVAVGQLLRSLVRNVRPRGARRLMPDVRVAATTTRRDAEQVAAVVEAGLQELSDTDLDPRRAVIACWVRLERAAADAGTPRQLGDTPTDLVTRLLRSHDVSADVLAAFAQVYRQARYATHTVDERMRAEARAALERLRAELRTEVMS